VISDVEPRLCRSEEAEGITELRIQDHTMCSGLRRACGHGLIMETGDHAPRSSEVGRAEQNIKRVELLTEAYRCREIILGAPDSAFRLHAGENVWKPC
jgi:hypothetical protein